MIKVIEEFKIQINVAIFAENLCDKVRLAKALLLLEIFVFKVLNSAELQMLFEVCK